MTKYCIEKSFNKQSVLLIGFYSDLEPDKQPHLQHAALTAAAQNITLPRKKSSALTITNDDHTMIWLNLGMQEKDSPRHHATTIKRLIELAGAFDNNNLTFCLPTPDNLPHPQQWWARCAEDALYRFKISQKRDDEEATIEQITFLGEAKHTAEHINALIGGMRLARTLSNQPANICTPSYMADAASKLATKHRKTMSVKVLNEKQLTKSKMGGILAVSQGSAEEARLIDLRYQGAGEQKPIVLVGKGITFDSGGLSLKPPAAMEEMKYDMCGAASVLGTLQAVADLALPVNVIGLMACSENLPGPTALKPGDVITTYSGKTVEVLNTDAEGRLVLCDALTYAEQFNPCKVIDIATLTGAAIVALGHKATAVMGNDQALCNDVLATGEAVYDRAWQLPLWEEYQPMMDSQVADIANISNVKAAAGTITAGCFLARFTEQYPWAHLDIAGIAWEPGNKRSASGRPIPLLLQLIFDHANRTS